MNERLLKLKKSIKGDSIFIMIITIIIIAGTAMGALEVNRYSKVDKNLFEVKLADEGEYSNKYCLFIDGENIRTVDYNEYSNLDYNNNTNEKQVFIISEIVRIINLVMIGFTFIITYFILRNIYKHGKVFSKGSIIKMRVIALLLILMPMVRISAKLLLTINTFTNASASLGEMDWFVMIIGVLIGVISEVFKYGYALQEDVDLIA